MIVTFGFRFAIQVYSELLTQIRKRVFTLASLFAVWLGVISIPARTLEQTTFVWQQIGYTYTPFFAGTSAAMGFSASCTFFGFYLLFDIIKKDCLNSVGALVLCSSTSRQFYIWSKFFAALLYLGILCCFCYAASLLVYIWNGEYPMEIVGFTKPFIIFAIPSMIAVAAFTIFCSTSIILSHRWMLSFYPIAYLALTLWQSTSLFYTINLTAITLLDYTGLVTLYLCYGKIGIGYEAYSLFPFIGAELANTMPRGILPEIFVNLELVAARLALILESLIVVGFSGFLLWYGNTPISQGTTSRTRVFVDRMRRKLERRIPTARRRLFHTPSATVEPSLAAASVRPITVSSVPSWIIMVKEEMRMLWLHNRLLIMSIIVLSLYAFTKPMPIVNFQILPLFFLLVCVLIADVGNREWRQMTADVFCAYPMFIERFALWKFFSALYTALLLYVPLAALFFLNGRVEQLLGIGIGLLWCVTLSTALGIITRSEKPFLCVIAMHTVVSLLASRVDSVWIDFATWRGLPIDNRWQLILGAVALLSCAWFWLRLRPFHLLREN